MARHYLASESVSMPVTADPPRWAEALLRAFLKPADFESVSGDLLEQYRDRVYPARGQRRAALWYVTQVFTFVSPGARLFAVLFFARFLTKTSLDSLPPRRAFHTRSTEQTVTAIGILVVMDG